MYYDVYNYYWTPTSGLTKVDLTHILHPHGRVKVNNCMVNPTVLERSGLVCDMFTISESSPGILDGR